MCIRHVEFLLLIWFPGVLHGKNIKLPRNVNLFLKKKAFQCSALMLITVSAQSAAQPCPALKLDHGYFVPEEETYSNDTKLFYACNKGLKPVVEGWWATSTCQNGTWSHKPQCIGKCSINNPPVAFNKKLKACSV